MNAYLMYIAIFLPMLAGFLILLLPEGSRKAYLYVSEVVTLLTAVLVWALIINPPSESVVLFEFVRKYTISFKIDGLSRVFAGLISTLWPLAVLYSFEYMEKEGNKNTLKERTFFGMYVVTYGVTLAIAFSDNLLSMYCFYEMLTLVTIPLVLFYLNDESIRATRTYVVYSLGGAAFAFISLIFLMYYGNSLTFTLGGVLTGDNLNGRDNILRLVYVLSFFGFGVKAAVFPVCSWLPKAGVAPTPVTALLHAVAVVKSGAFAIARLTYYSYGVDFLRGTWAQNVLLIVTSFTIVYGCSMAVKERHLKRRLAYSTVSNLSYILFGFALMSADGLAGGLTHMVFHGVMKIAAFFCVGVVIVKAEKSYVYELEGMGKRMPKVFAVLTVASLSLMGVPGLCGFVSKWMLAKASVNAHTPLAYVGLGALLVSALLTAIYMLQILLRAYYPVENAEASLEKCDPSWRMMVPLIIFALLMVFFGLYFEPLTDFIENVAGGLV